MPTMPHEIQQFQLARRLYSTILEHTESFEEEDHIGADLSYLLGAILFTGTCEWPSSRPIVVLLRQHFPPDDPLWQHITLERAAIRNPQYCDASRTPLFLDI